MLAHIRLIAITVSVCLVSVMPALSFVPQNLEIRADFGGEISLYGARVASARERNASVKFGGPCESACTLYLSLPADQLCITKDARFGFHAASGSSKAASETASAFLMAKYPRWVTAWIKRNGGLDAEMIYMDHSYAAKHIDYCKA